ncbi:MAG: hypothetical protein WC320_02200 [Candidatus Paceibacterota bacterium]
MKKFRKEALNNFIDRKYSGLAEIEKEREKEKLEERIAGEIKGGKYILVIRKEDDKGFFGIDREGNLLNI